mmetsp:Transcript_3291/g.11194  ORF Transcript_3291/g.11194 Transcript_3291/m.11194 type:complete len:330 (-) Transcript_3291:2605-3594(-)
MNIFRLSSFYSGLEETKKRLKTCTNPVLLGGALGTKRFLQVFITALLLNIEASASHDSTIVIPAFKASEGDGFLQLKDLLSFSLETLQLTQDKKTRIFLSIPSNQVEHFESIHPHIPRMLTAPYDVNSGCWVNYKTEQILHLLKGSLKDEQKILFAEADQIYFRSFTDFVPVDSYALDIAFTSFPRGIELGFVYIPRVTNYGIELFERILEQLPEFTRRNERCPIGGSDQSAILRILEYPKYKVRYNVSYQASWGLTWLPLDGHVIRNEPSKIFYRRNRERKDFLRGTCAHSEFVFTHFRGEWKRIMLNKKCKREFRKALSNIVVESVG